jgi:hypothetical protein
MCCKWVDTKSMTVKTTEVMEGEANKIQRLFWNKKTGFYLLGL